MSLRHAEETILRVDGIQTAIRPDFHPGYIVADALTFPTRDGGSHHREIGFSACRGKGGSNVYCFPSGLVRRRMSICSAIQPSRFAMAEAMRRARHFFPSKAFPPYPEPKDHTRFSQGND